MKWYAYIIFAILILASCFGTCMFAFGIIGDGMNTLFRIEEMFKGMDSLSEMWNNY